MSGDSGNTVNFTARARSRVSEASRPTSIRRSVRTITLGLTSVALSALFVFPASLPAAADPPLTAAEARAVIEQLETDAAAIDQQYAGVKEEIKQGRAQLKLKQADVKAQTEKVAQLKLQVGQVALAQFQNRSLDTAAQLFVTPDTDRFLSQISTVQKVSENQNSALQDFQQAQANLSALEHSAETDLVTLAEKEKQLKSLTEASDKKIAQAKKVLAKLTASQRKQISDAEETARANSERAATSSRSSTRGSGQSWRRSLGVREGSARGAIRSQWRWAEFMGLLGADNRRPGDLSGLACRTHLDSSTTAAHPCRDLISNWAIWCSSTTTSAMWGSTPAAGRSSTPHGPASMWSTSRFPTCRGPEPVGPASALGTTSNCGTEVAHTLPLCQGPAANITLCDGWELPH